MTPTARRRVRRRGRAAAPRGGLLRPSGPGGCVRDLLLGQTPADYDVATDATPEQVMRILPYRDGHRSGSRSAWSGCSARRQRGIEVEVATFRSDGAYIDGRRPESVVFSSPELDAARRDFTINGMFFDPVAERADRLRRRPGRPRRRVLRAIGDPAARFREDKLRLLRAVRFAARFGLAIEPATERRIRAMAAEVVGRLRRADRPGAAADARPPDPGAGDGPGAGLRAWSPPSSRRLVRDEGALPGQADAARGRPLGPHHARPRAPAARAELHAGVRRAAARRRQAVHPLVPARPAQPSTTTSRSARGSPNESAGA